MIARCILLLIMCNKVIGYVKLWRKYVIAEGGAYPKPGKHSVPDLSDTWISFIEFIDT